VNKEFIIKILQAKQLQYEALKKVMPENMLNRIVNIENELIAIGKEYFMKVIINPSNNNNESTSETKANIRKVTIE
jgi:endo-alpha-1,4-polygalactosaminidase (GH114 family)